MRKQVAEKTGVPIELLTETTQEALDTQAETLAKFITTPKAPYVGSDGFAPQNLLDQKHAEESKRAKRVI